MKGYEQFCPIAKAAEIFAERWTPLILKGNYTITKDPNRPHGLRVVMGPWTLYDKANIEAAAK
jgi:hypothetical protein